MTTSRIAVDIPVHPWFQDHSFSGTAVLPAVETMSLLAGHIAGSMPGIDVRVMEQARFSKFLEIPPGSRTVEALIECCCTTDGSIRARLLSRKKLKTMTRLQEHGEVLFSPAGKNLHLYSSIPAAPLSNPKTTIEADILYRDLVPFGSAYQTLQGTLFLSDQGAWGTLKAPEVPATDSIQQLIGSPFPLDGALHAACVHGQQYVDFIPFPVGFEIREICRPTRPGGHYITRIVPVSRESDQLLFDLGIFDENGKVYETVSGVRMQNVNRAAAREPVQLKSRP